MSKTSLEPVRLQLSRKKGFRLQNVSYDTNGLPAVAVTRGGNRKWGNPFIVGQYVLKRPPRKQTDCLIKDNADAVKHFRFMLGLSDRNYPPTSEILEELGGKNLACYCKLDEPCHADVLLEFIKNRGA